MGSAPIDQDLSAEDSAWKEFMASNPRSPEARALALARTDPLGLWPEILAIVDDGALLIDPARVFEAACAILAIESTVAPTAHGALLRKQTLGQAFTRVLDASDLEEPTPFRGRPLPERRALLGLLRDGPESVASRVHLRRLLECGVCSEPGGRARRTEEERDGP